MTPRFFRRVMVVAWATIAVGVVISLAPALRATPVYGVLVLAILFVALPVALWSPVALSGAAALAYGKTPLVSRASIALSGVAAVATVVALLSTGTRHPNGPLWDEMVRLTLPVMILATACALTSLLSMARVGPRLRWLGTCSVAAMFTLTALVTVMVIVDSGNHALFGVLGALLLVALGSALLVAVAHWRARLVAGQK